MKPVDEYKEVIPTVSGETSFGGQAYPKITPLPSMILTRWWKVISHRPYLLNPLQPNIRLHYSLYISWGADRENLFANQKVPSLETIFVILMTLMCDSGVKM